MSDSPFADYVNTTLTFQVSTGNLVENDETGNVQPEVKRIRVKAMLEKASNNASRQIQSEGAATGQIYLKGYWVDPTARDARIKNQARAACIWNGQEGTFTFYEVGKSPFFSEAEATGDRLEGTFVIGKMPFEL